MEEGRWGRERAVQGREGVRKAERRGAKSKAAPRRTFLSVSKLNSECEE